MLNNTIVITQTTSDLVKLIIFVMKTCTETITFLGHANQEAGSIRRTSIAMSLPKYLYLLAKNVPIPSEWIFGDDINTRINNIKAQQKAFKVDKTYFNPEKTFDNGQVYFPKKKLNNWERFPKIPGSQKKA